MRVGAMPARAGAPAACVSFGLRPPRPVPGRPRRGTNMSSVAAVGARRPVLADLVPGSRVRDLAVVVGGALLTAAVAQVALPLPFTPVPLTGQTFGVLLVAAVAGPTRGDAVPAAVRPLGGSRFAVLCGRRARVACRYGRYRRLSARIHGGSRDSRLVRQAGVGPQPGKNRGSFSPRQPRYLPLRRHVAVALRTDDLYARAGHRGRPDAVHHRRCREDRTGNGAAAPCLAASSSFRLSLR